MFGLGKKEPLYTISEHEHGIGKVLILKSPWQDKFADMMQRKGIRALRLPGAGFGFEAQPVDFMADLQFLRSVEIYHYGVKDIAPLAALRNIEILGLQTPSAAGLENWRPPLKVLLARWCKQLAPMLSIDTLEYINLTNFPYADLQKLETPRLKRLALTSRKLQTLRGVANLPAIEEVDFYNCPSLESVAELSDIQTMKTLKVDACRHISSKPIERRF